MRCVATAATLMALASPVTYAFAAEDAAREGSFARLGIGAGVGQDFVAAGLGPIPGVAVTLAGGYFLFPNFAFEVTAEGMVGPDLYSSDNHSLVQAGVSVTGRGYLRDTSETVYVLGGIGPAGAGRDTDDPRLGAGLVGGVGWEADDELDTWGVIATYALRIVGEPDGVVHGLHAVAYITFEFF